MTDREMTSAGLRWNRMWWGPKNWALTPGWGIRSISELQLRPLKLRNRNEPSLSNPAREPMTQFSRSYEKNLHQVPTHKASDVAKNTGAIRRFARIRAGQRFKGSASALLR